MRSTPSSPPHISDTEARLYYYGLCSKLVLVTRTGSPVGGAHWLGGVPEKERALDRRQPLDQRDLGRSFGSKTARYPGVVDIVNYSMNY